MKTVKKLIAVFLSLIIALAAMPMTAFSAFTVTSVSIPNTVTVWLTLTTQFTLTFI